MKPNKRTAAIAASAVLAIGVGGGIADAAQKTGATKADVAAPARAGPWPRRDGDRRLPRPDGRGAADTASVGQDARPDRDR